MRLIYSEFCKKDAQGEWWRIIAVNEAELDKFDLTGADIDGMEDSQLIAEGSIILTPTANYVTFEGGQFTQSQISSGGGGGGGGGATAGVESWNGRRGNVYPRSGDYNAAKITTSIAGKTVQDVLDALEAATAIDGALSPSSERAVANKAIYAAIQELTGKQLPPGGTAGQMLAKKSNTNYDTEWVSGDGFMKKSVYDANDNGKVDVAELADALKGPTSYKATLKNTYSDTFVLTDQDKGARNGVVPLDQNRKILPEFLPDNITAGLTYGGIFNAQTRVVRLTPAAKSILGVSADTMTLQNSSTVPEGYPANAELFYITTVADTFAGMTFDVGDWLISLGTEWQQLKNGAAVSSVQGKTGAVELNSDEITEGTQNLYMSVAERSKLQNIEAEATKDTNVIQSAQITTLPDGTRVLRLTNKNGTVTDFEGSGGLDADEYLKKTGNASQTFVMYTPSGTRQTFTGNEALALFFSKVVTWLNAIETVAWTGRYDDLTNLPTKLSQFTNDGNGNSAYPFITSQVNNLANYYQKTQTYTKAEVDALIDAIEGMNFIQVATLPTQDIDDRAIYYVPRQGGGYDRYQHMNGQWLYLGSTDVSMDGYLTTSGNASNVTTTFTMAAERANLVSGETLATSMGKLMREINDLKEICFTASWHDLTDGDELATQEDLEDYLEKNYSITDEGKVPVVGDDGVLRLQNIPAGVTRKGGGVRSVIGNDSEANPLNTAAGEGATAFGTGTNAAGKDQLVHGHYNQADNLNQYAEIIGGGNSTQPENIKTTDWGGNGWYKGKVSVGNTHDNIITPTQGNDLTPKTYVDKAIEEGIASANLLKSMVVTEVPDVDDADDNILYLIADPTQEDVYTQWKKVLERQDPDVYVMARLGSTQITSEGFQVTVLPTPGVAYKGVCYQYVGSGAEYRYGFFYKCVQQAYYAWLNTEDAEYYYTTSATPTMYAKIYSEAKESAAITATVVSLSGATLTDSAGKTYTRLSAQDTSDYEWQIQNENLSEYVNDGTGSGAPDDYFVNKKDLLNLIYPVGSIYITAGNTSPAELFGGTWQIVSAGRVLWGVNANENAGGTLDAQLPDIRGSVDFGTGSQGHAEFSAGQAFRNSGSKDLTWPQPSGTSSNGRVLVFRASYYNSTYVNNGIVRPAAYTVHMWRRTA